MNTSNDTKYELNDFVSDDSSNDGSDNNIDELIYNSVVNDIRELKKLSPTSTYYIKSMSQSQKLKVILEYDKVLQIVLQILDGYNIVNES
uniref:Uncharacterized protein n=1 Tax=viral metagenome TaxID=1070528 RepID=A0A6C0E680_9ZZZZ